jgi:hypothetical protein
MNYSVVLEHLPSSLEEMKKLDEAKLLKPEHTAALTVAALLAYPENRQAAFEMLDELRGPRPLSVMEKQFINDRFMDGKGYIPRSYLEGISPENNYTPSRPYTITMCDSHVKPAEEGYMVLDLKSSGADSPRTVTLRNKPSSGQWFLWDMTLLAGIREPAENNPWA